MFDLRRRLVTLSAVGLVTGLLVAGAASPAAAAPPAARAWVAAGRPTTHSYTPAGFFNSSGGSANITKAGTGHYTVTFFGLGPQASGGTVDVTPEGLNTIDEAMCSVVSWGPSGANLQIVVDCFDVGGAAKNTFFMLAFTSGGSTTGTTDYVLADSPSAPSYTPSAAYQFNSSGGTNTIKRIAAGTYVVSLPGPVVKDGTVKVTAYGASAASCQVRKWTAVFPGQKVFVDCYTLVGSHDDHEFTMTFTANDDLFGAGTTSGYAFGNLSTSPGYTPAPHFQYDTAGTKATAENFRTGGYITQFPAASSGGVGIEQATAYGNVLAHCIVDGPSGSAGGTETADVFCYDNSGNFVNAKWTMQWMVN